MILIFLLSITVSQFHPGLFLFLVYLILRDPLLIVMVSVCFMRNSSSYRDFLLTRILIKHYLTGSASNVIAIWQKILFKIP